MANEILTKRDGDVLRITLNRPEQGNGVTNGMAKELTKIISNASENVHFIEIRGAGSDFCTGRAGMGAARDSRPEALALRHENEVIFDCYAAFRSSSAPIIGCVQGRALGFGAALAALCDITIAADTALFQLPEMGHHIMPTMAMSSLIDRVPRKALMYLTYSTKIIDAERARSFGMVSDVVPAGILETTVTELGNTLLKAPRPAVRAVKEFTRTAIGMDITGAVDYARNLHATINSSSSMQG